MRLLVRTLFCAGITVLRASGSIISFTDTMLGTLEVPPNASTATGSATITIDTIAQTLTVNEMFSGLLGGPASTGDIHCCAGEGVAAGIAIPLVGFPITTSGTYSWQFDLTSAATYTSAFLISSGGTAFTAESDLITNMLNGLTYTNIHDTTFPAGEIRGQLTQAIPEPGTAPLCGACLLALTLCGTRRRR